MLEAGLFSSHFYKKADLDQSFDGSAWRRRTLLSWRNGWKLATAAPVTAATHIHSVGISQAELGHYSWNFQNFAQKLWGFFHSKQAKYDGSSESLFACLKMAETIVSRWMFYALICFLLIWEAKIPYNFWAKVRNFSNSPAGGSKAYRENSTVQLNWVKFDAAKLSHQNFDHNRPFCRNDLKPGLLQARRFNQLL